MRLPGELKFQALSISPADAQILDNRKFSVFDVCRFFGVHPDKVFVEQTSNCQGKRKQSDFVYDRYAPTYAQSDRNRIYRKTHCKKSGRATTENSV